METYGITKVHFNLFLETRWLLVENAMSAEYGRFYKPWQSYYLAPLCIHYIDDDNGYTCLMLVSKRFYNVASGLKGNIK